MGLLIPAEQEKLRPCLETLPNPEEGGEEEEEFSTSPVVVTSSSWMVAGLFEMELFEEPWLDVEL